MNDKKAPKPALTTAEARAARLAEQLRTNLRKRKAQARETANSQSTEN